MTVGEFLSTVTTAFENAHIATARLDAQVLLASALKQNKAWLLAHTDENIDDTLLSHLTEQIRRRAAHVPLAYIIGSREFYGRTFKVSPDVLIPRPETEQLIEALKKLPLPDNAKVLDVGTGSGAVAITAALELPHVHVAASDISRPALAVAEHNAERLGAQVYFFASNLLEHSGNYDVIVANLPYVDHAWQSSPETMYEPETALFADDGGLALILRLLEQVPMHLNQGGYVLLEADPRQLSAIKKAATRQLTFVDGDSFSLVFQKI